MGERNFHLHGNSFNRRAIGTEYETLACEYLTRHGYRFSAGISAVARGEIDIIARDRDYLVLSRSNTAAMNTKAIRRRQWMPAQAGADSSYRPVLYDALSYFRGHAVPV